MTRPTPSLTAAAPTPGDLAQLVATLAALLGESGHRLQPAPLPDDTATGPGCRARFILAPAKEPAP